MPENLVELYLNARSLRALSTHGSITTRYRNVVKQANRYPGWRDLLYEPEFRNRWKFILGADTTSLKIKGVEYYYLHAADIAGKDHLVYEIMEKEDAPSIKEKFKALRNAGYYPKLAVIDLAPELLSTVKEIWLEAKIQGCLFHLQQWLNKQLPTRRKRIDRRTLQLWIAVKKKIVEVAKAENKAIRQRSLAELRNMTLDEASSSVVKNFLANLSYYHTLQDLIWIGCKREYLYNNLCECSIGEIKHLIRIRRGFKNLENIRKYINAFWFRKRKEIAESHPIEVTTKEIQAIIPLFGKVTDLKELSGYTGFTFENLKMEAEKAGFKVVDNWAFSPEWLQESREKLEKGNVKTLMDGIRLIGDFPYNVFKLLGFELRINSLDPSAILLKPINKNQN